MILLMLLNTILSNKYIIYLFTYLLRYYVYVCMYIKVTIGFQKPKRKQNTHITQVIHNTTQNIVKVVHSTCFIPSLTSILYFFV